ELRDILGRAAAASADKLRRHPASLAQAQLPDLVDEIEAEAVDGLLRDQREPRVAVQVARREQLAVRPERHLPVARLPSRAHAFGDEAAADAEPARGWIDDQQPQLGDLRGLPDEENRSHRLAVLLRNPAAFAVRVEASDELADDRRHEALERPVVAVL